MSNKHQIYLKVKVTNGKEELWFSPHGDKEYFLSDKKITAKKLKDLIKSYQPKRLL